MFECVAVWDGELFAHTAATAEEAKEWAKCYTQQKNCAVRVWRVKI
jgi:hypothetical protein